MRKIYALFAAIIIFALCAGCKKNMENHTAESTTAVPEQTAVTAEETAVVQETIVGLTRESPEDEDLDVSPQTETDDAISTTEREPAVRETQARTSEELNSGSENNVLNTEKPKEPETFPGAPSAILSGETPED